MANFAGYAALGLVSITLLGATLFFAVLACIKRRDVGLLILAANMALLMIERLLPMAGINLYAAGGNTAMIALALGMVHGIITLAGWMFLALRKAPVGERE
jgi:hypothetical protein